MEKINNIFTNAIINRGPGNSTIIADGFFTTIGVGTQTLNVTPWSGASVTINSAADPGGRIQHDIIDLSQTATVATKFQVNGVYPEVLSVYGTPGVDNLTFGAAVQNGLTNGTISVTGSSMSSISYNGVTRLLVQTLGGNDTETFDNTTIPTVLNMGAGNNTLTVGPNPTVNAGTSAPLYVFGGGGNNTMTVTHNAGPIWLSGGSGNNTFTVNATTDTNGPITLNSGTGTEALTENARLNGNDTIVLTNTTIAGAGRSITYSTANPLAITLNDNGGSDSFWLMSTTANTTLTVNATSGQDAIQVEGNVPVVTYTPPAYSVTPVATFPAAPVPVVTPRVMNLNGFTFQVDANTWGNVIADYNGDETATANYFLGQILSAFESSWAQQYQGFAVTSTTIANLNISSTFNFPSYDNYDRYEQITVGTLLVNYNTTATQSQSQTAQGLPATYQPSYTFQAAVNHDTTAIAGHVTINGGAAAGGNGVVPTTNVDTLTVDDTGNTAGNTGVLTDSTLTGLNMGSGITYNNLAAGMINLGSGANSFSISVGSGKNLPQLMYINGGKNAGNVLTSAAWATDQNNVLDLTGFPLFSSLTVGGNFNGQIAHALQPGYNPRVTAGTFLSGNGALYYSPYTAGAQTITNVAVTGGVSAAAYLYTQNIATMTVGQTMAGLIDVTNNLTNLTIGVASSGQITADGAIGIIKVKAATAAQALKVREAGVPRILELTPVTTGGAVPTFTGVYQSTLSGIPLTTMNPVGVASPQLALEQTSANVGTYNLALSVYQDKVNTAAAQFVPPTYTIIGRNQLPKFNLSLLYDPSPTAGGLNNVDVDGDNLATVNSQSLSYLGLASTFTGGIRMAQDTLGGVSVRDYAAPASVSVKSLQALAFGEFTRSGVLYNNGQTLGLTSDANNILSTTTAHAQATGTYRVPFGQYPVVQYITTTTTNVFNTNYLYFLNEFAYDPYAASENLLTNATVNVSVSTTASGSTSSVSGLAFVGDGGAVSTSQAINGPITSTGPLGDIYIGATTGITGNITASRFFGMVEAGDGPIASTSTIQTTGIRTDPITGLTQAANPAIGQLVATTSGTTTTYAPTVISGVGSIAGKIISRGAIYSQITTTGNFTGLIAAVGNIGGFGTGSQPRGTAACRSPAPSAARSSRWATSTAT